MYLDGITGVLLAVAAWVYVGLYGYELAQRYHGTPPAIQTTAAWDYYPPAN